MPVKKVTISNKLITALKANGGSLRLTELVGATGVAKNRVSAALSVLVRDGSVNRINAGVYDIPDRVVSNKPSIVASAHEPHGQIKPTASTGSDKPVVDKRAYASHVRAIAELAAERSPFIERRLTAAEYCAVERDYLTAIGKPELIKAPTSVRSIPGCDEIYEQTRTAVLDLIKETWEPGKHKRVNITAVSDDDFLAEFRRRIPQLGKKVLHSIIDTADRDPNTPVNQTTTKKAKLTFVVAIVGVIGEQSNIITQYAPIARRINNKTLRVVPIEVSSHLELPTVDAVVMLYNMVSHKHQDQIKARLRHLGIDDKIHTVRGMTIMKDTVLRLTETWEKAHGIPQERVEHVTKTHVARADDLTRVV